MQLQRPMRKKKNLLFFQSITVLNVLYCFTVAASLSPDGLVLLEFKAQLNGTYESLNSWNATEEHPCGWTGITCSGSRNRVVSLNLPQMNLDGKIPESIGRLQLLQRLALHGNKLKGSIPADLANCTDLRALYLRDNYLTGEIPGRLGKLNNLMILDLSGNQLTGQIPESLGQLKRLKYLNLSRNFLSGKIPRVGVLRNFGNDSFVGNVELCVRNATTPCKDGLGFPALLPQSDADNDNVIPEDRRNSRKKYEILISVMVAIGSVVFLLMCLLWCCFLYKGNKLAGNYEKMSKECKKQEKHASPSKMNVFLGDLPCNSKQLLKKIAQLTDADVIGAGGYGIVYKFRVTESKAFAVKKIFSNVAKSDYLLKTNLEILASIKHRNLLDLKAFCCSSSTIFLISDFLPTGSLDDVLHGHTETRSKLDWNTRLKIAIGAARGLAYLHHECCPAIVHCDLKSSNIFLDENLEARVSDYGLAKLLEDKESHVTTIVAGTFGYMAPEYLQSGRATQKSDVYSFGVILLELFSGKRPAELTTAIEGLNVVGWIRKMLNEKKPEQIIDPRSRSCHKESMQVVLQIIVRCIAPLPQERPTMKDIVQMLQILIDSL